MRKIDGKKMRPLRLAVIGIMGALTVGVALGAQGAPVYDLDGSGAMDEGDAKVIKAAFAKCQGDAGYDARADYDGDNCITFADYQKWYAVYKGQ